MGVSMRSGGEQQSACAETREAQLDARERQIKEQQKKAVEAEARNERKVHELNGVLMELQKLQQNMSTDSFVDKQRLANEAERLRAEEA